MGHLLERRDTESEASPTLPALAYQIFDDNTNNRLACRRLAFRRLRVPLFNGNWRWRLDRILLKKFEAKTISSALIQRSHITNRGI